MEKMQGLVSSPGAQPAFQAEIYKQMSGISMQRGEIPQAKDFMEKSLEALKESFKGPKEVTEKQLTVLEKIEANTRKDGKEAQANAPASETIQKKGLATDTGRESDELQWAVKGGGTWQAGDWNG